MRRPALGIRLKLGLLFSGPALVALVAFVLLFRFAYSSRVAAQQTADRAHASDSLVRALIYQGRERGLTVLALGSPQAIPELSQLRSEGDRHCQDTLEGALKGSPDPEFLGAVVARVEAARRRCAEERLSVDRALLTGLPEPVLAQTFFDAQTALIDSEIQILTLMSVTRDGLTQISVNHYEGRQCLAMMVEYLGRERGTLALLLALKQPIDPETAAKLASWHAVVEVNWAKLHSLDEEGEHLPLLRIQNAVFKDYEALRQQIYHKSWAPNDPLEPMQFFRQASQAIDSLQPLSEWFSEDMLRRVAILERQANFDMTVLSLGLATLGLTGILGFRLAASIVLPIAKLRKASALLTRGVASDDLDLPTMSRDELGDLTDSFKIMVAELRDQKDRLQEVQNRFFELSEGPLCVLDLEGRFVQANPAWHRLLELPLEKFRGVSLCNFLDPAEPMDLIKMLSSEQNFEIKLLHSDGSVRSLMLRSSRSREQEVYFVAAYDQTQLELAKERLHAILSNLRDAVLVVDAGGRLLSLNAAAEAMFGFVGGELLGRDLAFFFDPPLGIEALIRDTRVEDIRGRRSSGELFACEINISEAAAGQDRFCTLVVRDVTNWLEAENRLKLALEKAEQSSRAKSAFLANMSHELRTPLNAILGFSQILEMQAKGSLNPKQLRQLNNIHSSGEHLLGLINDLLDLARIEAGHVEFHWESFEAAVVVSQSVAIIRPLAEKKGLKVLFQEEPVGDFRAWGDSGKYKQVLINLLSNGVKFTPEGGQLEIRLETDPSWLTTRVIDNGVGIKPEDQERIFLQFEQVDSGYSRTQQGTGLGLSLTRHLVRLHGGEIRLKSQEDVGSEFSFTIPRQKLD